MPPSTVTTVSALSVPSADSTIIASTIEFPRSRSRAGLVAGLVGSRCTSPPHRISSKLGIIRPTAEAGWVCGEVATRARASARGAVDVELDEPTAAYIAARGEIDERFAQRQLLSVLGIWGISSWPWPLLLRPIRGVVKARDHRLVAVADDDVHRLIGAELAARGGLGLGQRDRADALDVGA